MYIEKRAKIDKLAKWLKESNYTVILTGAGMSTESGIPDFRSKDGLWKKMDPMRLATTRTLTDNYDTFHEFYKMRWQKLSGCKPHKGYDILVKWEKEGLIDSVITQNVDDFHLISGNEKVYRLHGSLNEFRCSKCNTSVERKEFLDKVPCKECGGNLRPGIVLFGEGLPEEELQGAINEMEKAELVIVIGTSLTVFPVSQLPDITRGRKIYINKEIPRASNFDLNFEEAVGELLKEIDEVL